MFSNYILFNPVSVSDNIRSSAHMRELMVLDSFNRGGSLPIHFRELGRSDKKILKRRGLKMHPCFTP